MTKRPTSSTGQDLFTSEITRMALESITNEMATTMKLTSGSPVLTEGQDFSTALLTPHGDHITFAGYVTVHIGSSWLGTRLVMDAFPTDDVLPGDQFLSNDPFKGGACHAADNYVVKPLFVDGELVSWAYSGAHILDVGGADPGGWSPAAFDMFGEAIHIPPMKIVREGKINQDLCTIIENNVRLPRLYINDVKSFIAANNTADQRIEALIRQHGLEAFRQICAFNQELSESMMRERTNKIPDGVYTTVDWVEHDGHDDILFNVRCELTVDGSDLHFDFSGSDAQGTGGMNAAPAGLIGGVWTALVQVLAYDIPFNAGVMRPVRITKGEEGTLTNPRRPAATGAGHIDTGAKASKIVTELLSRGFAASDDPALRARVSAQFQDCFSANVWAVKDQYGKDSLIANMDSGGAGGAAQTCCDGLDAAAMMCQVNNQLPDVESNENLYPMLYLWKKLQTDSGGAGRQRGGLGLDFAWILWDTPAAHGMLNACTRSVPPRGAFGGLPPSTSRFMKVTNASDTAYFSEGTYPTFGSVDGKYELLPAKGFPIRLERGEVFNQWCGGGSGLGDPIGRDPEIVAADVRDGYVSQQHANKAYGVVLIPETLTVDAAATEQCRDHIRSERLGHKPSGTPNNDTHLKVLRNITTDLVEAEIDGKNQITCTHCGSAICLGTDNWRQKTAQRENDLATYLDGLGVWVPSREREALRFIEFFCPGCAMLLDTEIVRPGVQHNRMREAS